MDDNGLTGIRRGYAAFNSRDIDALLDLLDEDIEYRLPLDPMQRFPTYRGREGVRRFYETLWDGFEQFTAELDTANRVGDVVVVVGHFEIRRSGGEDTLRAAFTHFWRIAEGRAVQVSFHDAINPLALLEGDAPARRDRDRRARPRGDQHGDRRSRSAA